MIKRVIIEGCRYYNTYEEAKAFIDFCLSNIRNENEIVILSGRARGADAIGERYAEENGFSFLAVPFLSPKILKHKFKNYLKINTKNKQHKGIPLVLFQLSIYSAISSILHFNAQQILSKVFVSIFSFAFNRRIVLLSIPHCSLNLYVEKPFCFIVIHNLSKTIIKIPP